MNYKVTLTLQIEEIYNHIVNDSFVYLALLYHIVCDCVWSSNDHLGNVLEIKQQNLYQLLKLSVE